jgi:hypothetical protein
MTTVRTLFAAGAAAALLVAAATCGGSKQSERSDDSPGSSHESTGDEVPGAGETPGSDAGAGEAVPSDAGAPTSAVTFQLANTAEEDLVFSVDKGWQPVIFAYSGQPPKAMPIVMFPKWCTAGCDATPAEICPTCKEPETAKEERELETRAVVVPGEALDVPWTGQVYTYEKARGEKKKRCECWKLADPPPETYTVKACGFRVTKEAGKRSALQCAEGQMVLPPETTPLVVRLEFPAPPKETGKGKKKKR